MKTDFVKRGKKVELIEISEGSSIPTGRKGKSLGKGNTQDETIVEFDDGNVISVKTSRLKISS